MLGALGGVVLWFAEGARQRWQAWALTGIGALYAGISAWSVGGGRHLADEKIRFAFALTLAVPFGALLLGFAPRIADATTKRPRIVALVVLGTLVNLELVNQRVLVRLYPGFHLSIAVLTCILAPFLFLGWGRATSENGNLPLSRKRASRWWSLVPYVAFAGLLAAVPSSSKMLANFDNFRLLLVERAPLLGQGVRAAARIAPPPPIRSSCLASNAGVDCAGPNPSSGQTFSLQNRDLLLITIDALRADHVSAYGYGRKTTPNLDRLAQTGVRFERAYAPTAHTSYSVTSLMTGKYMRPLLLQGAGLDSDTWATLLQRYGVRTAAFYPPAVFFIDPTRFTKFRDSFLGFEYRKVEFLEGVPRAEQVSDYVGKQPLEQRLFVWVHLFAPHEPYEKHDGFDFGERDVDRYDSEIAFADDALGKIVTEFRRLRPGSLVIVGADHGEEFGDHGGRYHGTTVFEEQVRVPLVVNAPELFPARVVKEPVQTIDLLPTILASLDVPRPPRIRGRDLGGILTGKQPDGLGLALAETEEQLLLAEGNLRLVCSRQLGACKLYDVDADPAQTKDVSADFGERLAAMRRRERELSASHGTFETEGLRAEGRGWPSSILRGIAGDGDAADEIAGLLDDADVAIRRKSAELLFELKRPSTRDALVLALGRDEDSRVQAWAALALTRLGNGAPKVFDLLTDPDREWRRLAALALAETGDKRGASQLVDWWKDEKSRSYTRSRELLAAIGKIRYNDAIVPLTKSLGDVRLRPAIASALADIGDEVARGPLIQAFAEERYQTARVALAEALVRLKAKEELARPLARFLGVPDPIPGGLGMAARTGILEHVGGPDKRGLLRLQRQAPLGVTIRLIIPRTGNNLGIRAIVRVTNLSEVPGEVRLGLPSNSSGNSSHVSTEMTGMIGEFLDGRYLSFQVPAGAKEVELFQPIPAEMKLRRGLSVDVRVLSTSTVRVEAIAFVPLADEIPPPAPEPWKPGEASGSVGAGAITSQ
jgi:hypothetical protein